LSKYILLTQKSIHAIIIVSYLTRYLKIIAQDRNLSFIQDTKITDVALLLGILAIAH
ncbi:hypothetical protein L9F63_021677, partial [Diploptera punctata]